ncbi:MAG: hypothetical protein OXG58_09170 [Gemmatimonadetes bacterium]|nr:hypothetical protein [Gemmatimonadota bacterium]MCY3944584.1 hypothetical protein [Gemmatimonadota bacterium]
MEMTTGLVGIDDARTTAPAARGGHGDALRGSGTQGSMVWYWDASGGFIPETPDTWNPQVAFLVFQRITSSPRIERRDTGRSAVRSHHPSALPIADQVRELRTALSVNKSELARVLRVSRPTLYDWLDGGEPNDHNVSRIGALLRLLRESRVSSANPLFPRFVRSPPQSGGRALLDFLVEEDIDQASLRSAIRRAKALGDSIRSRSEEREARLRAAGFEEPDAERRKDNLATNVALMEWPRD